MLLKDHLGLIGQHSKDNIEYFDFGDSCMKTSIAVISGIEDPILLNNFIKNGSIIRHPLQIAYFNPKLTSRDQVVPLLAAMKLSGNNIYFSNYEWFVNKDIMFLPDVKWFKRKCSGDESYSLFGDLMMRISIFYAAKFDPDHELNQLFCMALVLGQKYVKMITKLHLNWEQNLNDYWSGWRDQPEISQAFIERIKKEL